MDIITHFADLTYLPAGYFAYDSANDIINYDESRIDSSTGKLCLLHETAHAQLGHLAYQTDMELYVMEINAWQLTRQLASSFNLPVSNDYIAECLETYEYWLEARSSCPDCGNFCLNKTNSTFHCFVCGCNWRVNRRMDCAVRRHRI